MQVVPSGAGAHPGTTSPFVTLGFPGPGIPELVYVEKFVGNLIWRGRTTIKEIRGMSEHEMDLSCAKWRKSSYSNPTGDCVETASARVWRKSSHSDANGGCVEVAPARRVLAVRDSKDPAGPSLAFAPEQWRAFTARVASGTLPLR